MSGDNGLYVGTKVPELLKATLGEAVKNGNYLNVSDFVRQAIREKLEKERLLHTSRAV